MSIQLVKEDLSDVVRILGDLQSLRQENGRDTLKSFYVLYTKAVIDEDHLRGSIIHGEIKKMVCADVGLAPLSQALKNQVLAKLKVEAATQGILNLSLNKS
ncbi:hypothetical protein COB21_02020 [Candidatus Aerophobetes bacterium]|uniref:Uncharacterized protein n=1 Tax=Aerophobetes bacterium TaxID=2030807 RepID=A0A2A4X769_UNCAE|nr:MAG: hypothetical protein COB21_02020 [Candidatus Aerophobetes bacterium]